MIRPLAWKSGSATIVWSDGPMFQMTCSYRSRLSKLKCEHITPFGRPVVPDV